MSEKEIQSVMFNKRLWSIINAKKWLKMHGFKSTKERDTKEFHRFRQRKPSGRRYRVKHTTVGIEFILQFR